MPKVIIREQDLSSTPIGEFNSFSVVIPGFTAAGKGFYYQTTKEYNIENGLSKSVVLEKIKKEDNKYYYINTFNSIEIVAADESTLPSGVEKKSYFDENNILEISSITDFENYVGKVAPKALSVIKEDDEPELVKAPAHYGNQIAYELLKLGYTVLYINMGNFNISGSAFYDASVVEAVNASISKLKEQSFWEPLKDKATYDFRFVCTGLMTDPNYDGSNSSIVHQAAETIVNLCGFAADGENTEITSSTFAARGDACALIDLDENVIEKEKGTLATSLSGSNQALLIDAIKKAASSLNLGNYGKYAAIFVPNVCYTNLSDIDYDYNNKLPASFHYLACFAQAVLTGKFAEWYAIAGYTRGVSSYTIDSTTYKLGDLALNELEPRTQKESLNFAVNVISNVRNNFYLWGNRTAELLNTSDLKWRHFLNIRQLCSTLKKQIYNSCRQFTFDPNSDTLWINFCNTIRPTLESMKGNEGIFDYKIIKVSTTQKAKLKAKVRIIPIEAVEDFDVTITLEDSFGATTATVVEG